MKKIITSLLLLGIILFVVFRPDDAKALWTTMNLRLKGVLEGNKTEYTPPKGYFFDAPLQIYRWPEAGRVLELSDHSKWRLRDQVPGWSITHEVEVSYSTDPDWPYVLRNTDRPSQTFARYEGMTE